MPGGASFMHIGGMPGGMNGFPGMGPGAYHRPGGGGHASPATKAAAVNHNLNVTLEELYTGTVKKMRITKRIIDTAGRQSQVSNEKEITLKKGWKDGTKITYEKEGDESPGVIPADIIFTVQTKPHPLYSRDNDDLIYTCTVTLLEALTGFKKEIRTLDNRPIFVEMRSVKPDTITVDSLTHLLTHSLTHSLTHPLTYSPTYLLTHPLTHSLTHLLTHSPTYSLICFADNCRGRYAKQQKRHQR